MKLIKFSKSNRKNKKYMMVFENPTKTIHFGSDVSQTFVEGASEEKKKNYLLRHKVREKWNEINAGSASRFILWGNSRNINTNLKEYLKKFNIENSI